MPGVAVSSMLVVSDRIERAIKKNFDEKTQSDVRQLLRLSDDGGGNELRSLVPLSAFTTIMFAILIFVPKNPGMEVIGTRVSIVAAIFLGMLTVGLFWFFRDKRDRARRELDELLASNPTYWQPISEKLTKIILEAGKFTEPWGARQFTKISGK